MPTERQRGPTRALAIVIVAEMCIGASEGLGRRVFAAQQLFEMPDMHSGR
jgi:ABC-type nitrate/sulfonate/bicarbonate transport system permease component